MTGVRTTELDFVQKKKILLVYHAFSLPETVLTTSMVPIY